MALKTKDPAVQQQIIAPATDLIQSTYMMEKLRLGNEVRSPISRELIGERANPAVRTRIDDLAAQGLGTSKKLYGVVGNYAKVIGVAFGLSKLTKLI